MKALLKFIKLESSSACLLLGAAMIALILSNSPWHDYYANFIHQPIVISFSSLTFKVDLLFLINECLMTLFFLVVGIEIKYELLYGDLNSVPKAILPGIAAFGGIIVPALIFTSFNYHSSLNMQGWAVPIATDIAIALGVISLLGSKIPSALKVFLMALAIFDDLVAIIIIAVFYTANFSLLYLFIALACVGVLFTLKLMMVNRASPYCAIGIALWICLLKLGIHPTLAGVILAFLMPIHSKASRHDSPSLRLKEALHPWVALGILPCFAFANAGVSILRIPREDLQLPIILGTFLGLFIGKQIGIFGFSWLAVKLRIAQLPEHVRWIHIYGVAIVSGIGFTMSLFIGALAFDHFSVQHSSVKIGVLLGSFVSGVVGYSLLSMRGFFRGR